MTDLFTLFWRRRALRRDASGVPTGFAPLSRIRRAAVFLDATAPDGAAAIGAVHAWCRKHGIEVQVYALSLSEVQHLNEGRFPAVFFHRQDLNWYGRIRRREKTPAVSPEADLFISLIPDPLFAVEHAATSSKAFFKVGRHNTRQQLFDLVVADPEGRSFSQGEVFAEMTGLLEKVR